MARLPRLYIPGQSQYVILRSLEGHQAFKEDADCEFFLECLATAARTNDVAVHAYTLLPNQVHLLVTPSSEEALPLAMQAVGRRYVAAFNRKYNRRGTVWEGRYRATVIEGASWAMFAYQYIDKLGVSISNPYTSYRWSSYQYHVGNGSSFVVHRPEYWALGNTPFERQYVYRTLCEQPLDQSRAEELICAATKGWVLGGADYLEWAATAANRRVTKLKRGRPRKNGGPRATDPALVAKTLVVQPKSVVTKETKPELQTAPPISIVTSAQEVDIMQHDAPPVVPTVWPTFPSLHGRANDDTDNAQ